MARVNRYLLAFALALPLSQTVVLPVDAAMGPSQIAESMSTREILEAADNSLEEARAMERELTTHLDSLSPQSDTLAADLRDGTAVLAEVRGFLAVAEQHRASLELALSARSTDWGAVEHAYSMVWTACNQAVARVAAILQQGSQASRYSGERLLIAQIDGTIPERDTTETGDVEEVINLPGVEDRAVDSPVF